MRWSGSFSLHVSRAFARVFLCSKLDVEQTKSVSPCSSRQELRELTGEMYCHVEIISRFPLPQLSQISIPRDGRCESVAIARSALVADLIGGVEGGKMVMAERKKSFFLCNIYGCITP
jgi:hypothetical protein